MILLKLISLLKSNKAFSTAAIVALVGIIGVASIFFSKPDNMVEEVSETIIEKELNLPNGSLDFTPSAKK